MKNAKLKSVNNCGITTKDLERGFTDGMVHGDGCKSDSVFHQLLGGGCGCCDDKLIGGGKDNDFKPGFAGRATGWQR